MVGKLIRKFFPDKYFFSLYNLFLILRRMLFIRLKKIEKKPYCELKDDTADVCFGYHDVSPFNYQNNKILAHRLDGNAVTIGYFELENPSEFVALDKTTAYCWQLASRLQWISDSDTLIFNAIDESNSLISKKINIMKKSNTSLPWPIFDIDRKGNIALTLNFSRLGKLRPGYGYPKANDFSEGIAIPDDDGVFTGDLETGERKLIISLKNIASKFFLDFQDNYFHYNNHLKFNPSSSRFVFFHLAVNKDKKRILKMFTSDLSGREIFYFSDLEFITHFTWINDKTILLFGKLKNKKVGYYLVHDNDNCTSPEFIDIIFNEDGHPWFVGNDDSYFVTDSYPDKFGDQYLTIIGKSKIKRYAIFSPGKFRGAGRCDLHPRLSRDNRFVCVDSTYHGKRSMLIYKLADLL